MSSLRLAARISSKSGWSSPPKSVSCQWFGEVLAGRPSRPLTLGSSACVDVRLVLGFEPGEDFAGPFVDAARHAGELGDVDAVALVGRAGDDLVQEHDLVLPLLHGDVEVPHAGELVCRGR